MCAHMPCISFDEIDPVHACNHRRRCTRAPLCWHGFFFVFAFLFFFSPSSSSFPQPTKKCERIVHRIRFDALATPRPSSHRGTCATLIQLLSPTLLFTHTSPVDLQRVDHLHDQLLPTRKRRHFRLGNSQPSFRTSVSCRLLPAISCSSSSPLPFFIVCACKNRCTSQRLTVIYIHHQ